MEPHITSITLEVRDADNATGSDSVAIEVLAPNEPPTAPTVSIAPDPATTLVLVATKLKGNHGVTRAIKKHGAVLTFNRMKAWQVPDWVMAEARRIGHGIDEGTARLVTDLAGLLRYSLRASATLKVARGKLVAFMMLI